MKAVKGFGKNYFSLSAIQATVSAVKISAQKSYFHQEHSFQTFELENEEDEFEELSPCLILQQPSSHHCSCHFRRRSYLTLSINALSFKNLKFPHTLFSGLAPPPITNYFTQII